MTRDEMRCPKCGNVMHMVPESDWQLYEVRTVDYICPVCLHVERVKTIIIGEE